MARTGLTKAEVKASRDRLLAEGRYPSVDAVRLVLGTGSKSTIHKYLKELQEDGQQPGIKRDDTERSLHALVEQLAGRLHADAERRLRDLHAEHELALQQKDLELADLRRQLKRLAARIEQVDAYADQPHDNGFGNFSNLFASSRGGRRDDTPFNSILAGGRAMTIDFDSPQIQLSPRLI